MQFIKLIIALLVVICFTACKNENYSKEAIIESRELEQLSVQLSAPQLENAKLTFARVEKRNLPVELNLNGKVFTPASEKISIHAPLSGYIKSLPWMQGMAVRKGQLLAFVEDIAYLEIQQDYLEARTALELAESEWKRQQQLLATRATSDKVAMEAKYNYEKSGIAVQALKQKLTLINIDVNKLNPENLTSGIRLVAPDNGFVQSVNSNLGDYVNPQDEIMTLVTGGSTMVALNAFEKDLAGLATGQKVSIAATVQPDKKYNAVVTQIGKSVGMQGNVDVICRINDTNRLIEGQYVSGSLTLINGFANCVPENSIVHYEGKDYVFVVEFENRFSMVEVIPGSHSEGWVEIKNGDVIKDRQIVNDASYTLLMTLKNVEE